MIYKNKQLHNTYILLTEIYRNYIFDRNLGLLQIQMQQQLFTEILQKSCSEIQIFLGKRSWWIYPAILLGASSNTKVLLGTFGSFKSSYF